MTSDICDRCEKKLDYKSHGHIILRDFNKKKFLFRERHLDLCEECLKEIELFICNNKKKIKF